PLAEFGIVIPLISTTDAHREDDPEFRQWPPHCVAGTTGQLKPGETLLSRRTTLGVQTGASIELGPQIPAQIIVEKQALDVFTNPNFTALLDSLDADRYVVYGVATDCGVRCAVTGLLGIGKPVVLVTDAIDHVTIGFERVEQCSEVRI